MIRLHIAGRDETVTCAPQSNLLLTLRAAGIPMDTECGGLGRCGLCRVQFGDGAPPASHADHQFFAATAVDNGWRLACTSHPTADGRLTIPEALAAAPLHILTDAGRAAGAVDSLHGSSAGFGAAIDVGTTTVVCYLMDLADGKQMDVAAFANPQRGIGPDVVTRIVHAHRGPHELRELQTRLVTAIETHLADLCAAHRIDPQEIHTLTAVGNNTMMHLLCGVDPWPLGVAPYEPVFTSVPEAAAGTLGFRTFGNAQITILPGVGGQLGSDTVAGLLALGPRLREGVHLFLDLGTNGEIVLCMEGTALGCSCAAGPAFEGVRIAAGTPAVRGAIDTVTVTAGELHWTTIQDAPPVGICGSGLVDTVAVLLQHGLLDPSGRLQARETLAPDAPQDLADRLHDGRDGRVFHVYTDDGGGALALSQQDLREIQLAKGAVRTGVDILLRVAGVAAADVDGVFVAGAFGTALRPASVAALGLLPPEMHDRVQPIGNAAGLGARLALAGGRALEQAHALAQSVTHVSLAAQPDFQRVFADSLRFPDPAPRA